MVGRVALSYCKPGTTLGSLLIGSIARSHAGQKAPLMRGRRRQSPRSASGGGAWPQDPLRGARNGPLL